MGLAVMVPRMPDPGGISEDRGFKALISSYPAEAIEVFVPELLSERGRLVTAAVLQQESPLPDLAEPSRFLDVALLATWADGGQAVILLIEHWSQVRKVDLRRVTWYVADLALRHPHAVIYPVVLVTDPGTHAIPERWEMVVAGVTTLALQVRVYRVTAAELPRLRSLQNRIAAVLTALAAMDAVDAVVATLEHMARSPGPFDDLERFLPCAMKLAKLPESDRPRLRHRLEEVGMWNPITEIREAAEARGKVAEICRLVERGLLARDAARAEIRDLMNTGIITREIGQEALSQIP